MEGEIGVRAVRVAGLAIHEFSSFSVKRALTWVGEVELTEKLIQEGKDFSQIYYPEESHGFVRDETLIDSFRRTADWLDRHLQ